MPAGPASADVDLVLAAEFPTVDRKQWSAALAGALDRTGTLEPQEAMARLRSRT